ASDQKKSGGVAFGLFTTSSDDLSHYIIIPCFVYNSLSDKSARKELKISPDQEKKLQEISDAFTKSRRDSTNNIRQEMQMLAPQEQITKLCELSDKLAAESKKIRKQIDELLTTEQRTAAISMSIGMSAAGRLTQDQQFRDKIGVSDQQNKELWQRLVEDAKQNEKLKGLPMKDIQDKWLAVLTPQQWEKLEQLVGDENTGIDSIMHHGMRASCYPGPEAQELSYPELCKQLSLSEEQQTKLDEIGIRSQAEANELGKTVNKSNLLPDKGNTSQQDNFAQKLAELRKRDHEAIKAVLSAQQWSTFKKSALRHEFLSFTFRSGFFDTGNNDKEHPGLLDMLDATGEQKAEFRKRAEELERMLWRYYRESGDIILKIIDPKQQEKLFDELDRLLYPDPEPPADAVKSSNEKQSLTKSGAGMMISGNSSADAQGEPSTPAEGDPAIGNEKVRSLAASAPTKVQVDGLEQGLGTGKGIMTREQAIRELEKAGADVRRPNGKDVFYIILKDKKVGDEVLPWIGRIPETRFIDLARTNVSDAGLTALSPLRNLEILVLTETGITDGGVKQICEHKSLWHLNLGGTKITDDIIPELAKMPRLTELMLTGNPKITDRAIERLIPLKSLKTLILNGSRVTDDGLRHLKELPNLQTIDLYETGITDKGIQELAEIQSLRNINLNNTQITNVALDRLASLPNLEHLEVSSNRGVSKGAVEAFKKAHPRCKVEAYGQMGQ
ncbi:MAG: hypothetical protein ABSA77_00670, partial [Thermoguttaceae bacterium]